MDYVVRSGDTMWAIARRFCLPLDALIAANPQIADPNLIYPGQVLHIPLLPPVDGWCALVMPPRHPAVPKPGVALVRRGPDGQLLIALHDMPDPCDVDPSTDVYRGWLLAENDEVRARVPLHSVRKIFWIGHRDVCDPMNSDRVVVTAESRAADMPYGFKVYDAPLSGCCPPVQRPCDP